MACSRPVEAAADDSSCALVAPAAEVRIAGGAFTLGARPERPEEGPAQTVTVEPFWIDATEVTNAEFAEFVAATGYVTVAERAPDPADYPDVPPAQLKPAALVFVGSPSLASGDLSWWRLVDGASWRHPEGPGSTIAGRERHPVVEVAWEDALAYGRWRGRDLPTEAEWEFAARGGLDGARFEWGDEASGQERPRANTWQGVFPAVDGGQDGYKARTAPVGCFPASPLGLYDMTGNVWEWTRDLYAGGDQPEGVRTHLIKGGSFLCADNFCLRYRPSARQGGPPDTGSSHIGFRTVRRKQS
jgi:formylglycine-generating enzyme required for sulfatase activity